MGCGKTWKNWKRGWKDYARSSPDGRRLARERSLDLAWANANPTSELIVMSTQKTAWLIVACCLVLFASVGLAQEEFSDPPRWYVNREIDAITDDNTLFAHLSGQIVEIGSPRFDHQTLEGATSTITIFCGIGPLTVDIRSPEWRPDYDWPIWLDFAGGLEDRDVIVRFDSEEPKTERWKSWGEIKILETKRDSGPSDTVYPPPYLFLERLATGAHHKLAIRTTDHDITWTVIFNISEAAPIAQEVLETCPESD